MLPNDKSTENLIDATEAIQDFTSVIFVGNFFLNLLLSGAMTFLWGLLHCMQIVAHFPLVNIMMPANAQHVFKIIVQIATMDLLPTEPVIEDFEKNVGIMNDDYFLTDSFVDFDFDSTAPIRNL